MKKTVLSYAIAVAAGVISFFAALNLRSFILLIYRIIKGNQIQWEGSLVNTITIILLMIAWIVHLFYTQYFFEKKCNSKSAYINASLRLILPVVIIYAATQILFLFIS